MHVLYVHQYFSTREGAAGTRSYELARALIAKGHQVTMLCGSTGRSVTGLEGPFVNGRRTGVVEGINVREFDVSYTNYDSLPKRAWKFVEFALQSVNVALSAKYDVIFTTSTPLTAAIPGAAAFLLRGKPFIFEIRDLWPELPRALGLKNPFALAGMHVLEWMGYHSASRMVALAPGIADGIGRLGVPRSRIEVVPNGCDIELFDEQAALSPHQFMPERIGPNDLVAIFAGAHGIANGLEAVIDAAQVLKRRGRGDIKLLLVGDGVRKPALIKAAIEKDLDNVAFHDPIPKRQLISLVKGTHVGLQILADVPAFYRGTSPNKFFDYLAAGRTVLINYPGWLAEFVQQEGCGFGVPPRNPEAFADALMEAADNRPMLEKFGARSHELGAREFDRRLLADRFVKAVQRGARERRSRYSGLKRGIDILAATVGLAVFATPIVIIAGIVAAGLGRPILFRQSRVGAGGENFSIMKFRTMMDVRDAAGNLLPDEVRLTPLGQFLRRFRLDELPEILQILSGLMSLVGPRPLPRQIAGTSDLAISRQAVRPGMTGLSQVSGNTLLSFEEKLSLDVWYVEHRSLILDITIILKTLVTIIRGERRDEELIRKAVLRYANDFDRDG